jgi:hypothetical protein
VCVHVRGSGASPPFAFCSHEDPSRTMGADVKEYSKVYNTDERWECSGGQEHYHPRSGGRSSASCGSHGLGLRGCGGRTPSGG